MNYIVDYLHQLDKIEENSSLDLKAAIQKNYNLEIQEKLKNTVWASGCKSWYQTENGKNTTIYPALTITFRKKTRHINPEDYEVLKAKNMALENITH